MENKSTNMVQSTLLTKNSIYTPYPLWKQQNMKISRINEDLSNGKSQDSIPKIEWNSVAKESAKMHLNGQLFLNCIGV